MVLGLACSARAVDRAQLNHRIQSLTAQFTAMEQNPATRVPAYELAKANGIVLLDRTKGAFFFGYQSGNGVAFVKDSAGHWSAPAFVSAMAASLGPQIGGTKDFFVVLLTSPAATDALKKSVIDLGAKASAIGGNDYHGVEQSTASGCVMVYGAHNGLFAGAEIKGGTVSPDNNANAVYYDQAVSMNQILFNHQVTPTPTEDQLIAKISEYSR